MQLSPSSSPQAQDQRHQRHAREAKSSSHFWRWMDVNTGDGQALRFFGVWRRQASVINGLSSRALMAGRLTKTSGNPS